MEEVKKFLEINGLRKERLSDLTSDVEEKLIKLLPKNVIIKDDFELNCYYRVFSKKL